MRLAPSAFADRSSRRRDGDVSGNDQLGVRRRLPYRGPLKLEGDPKGASVIILGAGLAGMTAAYELGRAGYRVEVLE